MGTRAMKMDENAGEGRGGGDVGGGQGGREKKERNWG